MSPSRPRVGLSLMPHAEFARAVRPLFTEGLVEALEWTVDQGWGPSLPDWVDAVLERYASLGLLYGHGVGFSLLSGRMTPRQLGWLDRLRSECRARPVRRFSEHFGFVTAGDVVGGAPLPLPLDARVLAIGRDRLARLADAAGAPVDVENLAVASSRAEAESRGAFLEALLEPINGGLHLDLHNLWCQIHNFDLDPTRHLERLPLHRVHRIHLAGGSWWHPKGHPARRIRRDTHDGELPEPVLELLDLALERCDQLEVVVVERLGHTLAGPSEQLTFAEDYRRVHAQVAAHGPLAALAPVTSAQPATTESGPYDDSAPPRLDAELDRFQRHLLDTCSGAEDDAIPSREAVAPPGSYGATWLASADPDMWQLFALLVRHWAQRSDG